MAPNGWLAEDSRCLAAVIQRREWIPASTKGLFPYSLNGICNNCKNRLKCKPIVQFFELHVSSKQPPARPRHNRREEERERPLGGVSGSRRGARGRWEERGLMERCLRGAAGARAPLPWRPLCLAAPVAGPGTRSGCGRGQAEAGRARLRLSPFSAPGMAGSAPRRVSASSLSFAPPAAARGSGVP